MLKSASRILSEARPTLFLALHSKEQRQECEVFLRDVGYGLYALDGSEIAGPIETDEIVGLPRGSASARIWASCSRTSLHAHAPS